MNISDYQTLIQQLETELDEMTIALSQAWDQLVPFLQDMPTETETTQDIEPILHTIAAAADVDFAGVYLFKVEEWHSIPHQIRFAPETLTNLITIRNAQTLKLESQTGEVIQWVFAPVITENDQIGVLGIGTTDHNHAFTAVDLRIIARMADRIGSQITAAQLARLREKEMIRQHDMNIANQIQQSVQPEHPPQIKGLDLASYWQPSREVGGDAWGWVQVDANQLTCFILDVSGKGLPAALAAVALHTAISMALRMNLSPVETLKMINAQFYDAYTRTDLLTTVAIMTLNTTTGRLDLANAGHPPVLVKHQGKWLKFPATVPPIGVLPTIEPITQTVDLQPDDLIMTYSDGFTEIETGDRFWGQTGLLNAVPDHLTHAQTINRQIVSASQHAGSIEDDQTLITIVYTGEPGLEK